MRRWLGAGWGRWAIAAVLIEIAYLTAMFSSTPDGRLRLFLTDGVYTFAVFAATVASVTAVRRAPRSRRRWWWLVSAANVLWLSAEIYWVAGDLLGWDVPIPSLADAMMIASYLTLLVSAGLGFRGASALRQWRGQLDGLLVVVVIGTAGWHWLVGPQLAGTIDAGVITYALYPLLDVAFLMVFLTVGLAGHHRVALPMLLALASMALTTVNDVIVALASANNADFDYSIMKAFYLPVVLMLTMAAVADWRGGRDGAPAVRDVEYDLGAVPIVAAVGVTLLWAGAEVVTGHLSRTSVSLLAALLIGITVRSQLSIRDQRRIAGRLDAALDEQRRLAITDALTGLYNRRFGDEMMQLEAERSRRDGTDMAVVIVDLDHFKSINDTHGHQAGDIVLGQAAVRLSAVLRADDVLVRWGGEEFLAVLPRTGAQDAHLTAERMRAALSDRPLQLPGGDRLHVTGSLGVAGLAPENADGYQLVRIADEALYAAKEGGRNRVVSAAEPAWRTPAPVSI